MLCAACHAQLSHPNGRVYCSVFLKNKLFFGRLQKKNLIRVKGKQAINQEKNKKAGALSPLTDRTMQNCKLGNSNSKHHQGRKYWDCLRATGSPVSVPAVTWDHVHVVALSTCRFQIKSICIVRPKFFVYFSIRIFFFKFFLCIYYFLK